MRTVVTPQKLRHVTDVPTIDYQNASDEELMVGYSRGDAASFDELYRRNKGPLYRYFLRHTSQVPVSEELTHEVWLRVINTRQRYLRNAKFTTFLFHIAHNCLVDHYRKFSRVQQVDCGEYIVDEVPSDDELNPESQLRRSQARKALTNLLMQN